MKYDDPLFPVMEAYEVSIECFKMAKLAIQQQAPVKLIANFSWLTKPGAQQNLAKAKAEVNDLFVFLLWATFERFVITYLQDKGAGLQTVTPIAFANPLYEHFQKEVEFWNQKEILDLLKKLPSIDKNSIGQAKQILDYRNWIAHGCE